MLTQIDNNKGIISYDDSLIEQIITEALRPFRGSFKMVRTTFSMKPNGMYVSLEVKLKFGTSINEFSTNILSSIAIRVENNLELPVYKIRLLISGVYSKKVARRNILIEYDNKSEIKYYGN